MAFPIIVEDEEDIDDDGVSLSVASDQMLLTQVLVRDVIVIDTDSESQEEKKQEEAEEENEEEEEEQEDEVLEVTPSSTVS